VVSVDVARRQTRSRKPDSLAKAASDVDDYATVLAEISKLISDGRRGAVRAVDTAMTSTYWLIGRRIVEAEQRGAARAGYGEELIERLSRDLVQRAGRGFGVRNLASMRRFFLCYPQAQVENSLPAATAESGRNILQTLSAKSSKSLKLEPFPQIQTLQLPWSHYTRLVAVKNDLARQFYETEALRGGWTARQLSRQIDSQFYERTALSRHKVAMLQKGEKRRHGDEVTPEQEIRDPVMLEFLHLKDEYSETDLEEALIRDLETFLLELGSDFAFIGRQRRLRIGDQWFRVDLLLFHRRLRSLIVIDLKLDKLTHADAGQMHMYLNYARKHWTIEGENPPVGLILCTSNDASVAEYALEGLTSKVLATEYRTTLPSEKLLIEHIDHAREQLLAAPRRRAHRGS
jgi:predicted nuclease of restriction endonuclease-like (RecB) superfamily